MKILLLTTVLIPLLVSCGRETNIIITGEIKEAGKTRVYLERIEVNETRTVDSTRIDPRGRFSFAVHDTLPVFYALRFSNNERVTVVASPGDTLSVSGTLEGIHDNYWVDGSEDALWIKLLDFQMNRTVTTIDSLKRSHDSIPAGEGFNDQRARIEKAFREALEKQVNFTREFILAHAISPAAYYALYQRITPDLAVMDEVADYQSFKIVASSMNALYPGSPYTVALMNHLKEIAKTIRDRQLLDLINSTEGSLPAVRLPDVKGNLVSLSELKNKLIILDFNLLGARESLERVREMQRVYDKFRARGVEIYQVCLDGNRLLWEELVERLGIKWICTRDENALQSRTAAAWNVKEIPANYIISRQKEIVGKNLYGSRLEERLAELLDQ
ncbi:MAG: AhpC/TSA family protein [Odoribacteraceae bacterium]|jgi:peroxiredoxin|nr:AhpC/TSA family protein [Odoribacteraceae bacterium]